ncbi:MULTISPECIES: glycosyltransferase family protein [Klebsiella]|uniref:hypothetical protein n=1 Tax=Klebsiella TaxID=570 RepID=UPI001158641E|nr:hypothetical protein [Klebsiella michiganensis]ELT9726203.1 hypothetical protein [Klebsiella michiganensis]MBQ4654220.1 hypothetical protein [Klebsiella michiganensis]MBQ4661525.1 hypothetical protein [Klebsiella michiganensis]MCW9639919.1 hypothetical protein [Klebsiella michiganensis]MDK3153294.1 hypothetical protein [Klebsiella michiganensis]
MMYASEIQKPKFSILVVLYDKDFHKSNTLKILNEKFILKNVSSLFVVNNGPCALSLNSPLIKELKNDFLEFNYKEYLDNKPLSKIYNEFILSTKSHYYIIFDDDSCPEESYFNHLKEITEDLCLPRIKSKDDGLIYYPCIDMHPVIIDGVVDVNYTMSISSGLVISESLALNLQKHYSEIFDERYCLYGIDTSFFFRLRKLASSHYAISATCAGDITHSLSRVTQNQTDFRIRERLYDVAITTRWYSAYYGYKPFIRKLLANIVKFKFQFAVVLVSTYIIGKHPRT